MAKQKSITKPSTAKKKAATKKTAKKTPATKVAAKKPVAKKPAPKKTTAKKPVIKKTTSKKPALKKVARKKIKAIPPEELHMIITQRAYFYWENAGSPEGNDFQHWLEAEREIKAMYK